MVQPLKISSYAAHPHNAIEDPVFRKLLMSKYSCEDQAEDIILLDNMWVERCLLRTAKDFTPMDQSASPCSQECGTNRRHLEISRLRFSAGSSLALPAVNRLRHNSASTAASSRLSIKKNKPLKNGTVSQPIAISHETLIVAIGVLIPSCPPSRGRGPLPAWFIRPRKSADSSL